MYKFQNKSSMDRQEAIKVIKDNWPESRHQLSEALQTLIPEFQESEDEKVRKRIIRVFRGEIGLPTKEEANKYIAWLEKQGRVKHTCRNCQTFQDLYQNCPYSPIYQCTDLTEAHKHLDDETLCEFWLEKQGEQKPVDKTEPKFKVGDWITNNCFIWCIKNIHDGLYDLKGLNGGVMKNVKSKLLIDNNFHIWTIQDAKDGDVLANKNGAIFINAGSSDERVTLDCYCYLTIQNEFCIEYHKTGSWLYKDDIIPATKEQCILLFSKMKEAGYYWDYKKKELKRIEQKSTAWSEEDERMFKNTIALIETIEDYNKAPDGFGDVKFWLESLKKRIKGE